MTLRSSAIFPEKVAFPAQTCYNFCIWNADFAPCNAVQTETFARADAAYKG